MQRCGALSARQHGAENPSGQREELVPRLAVPRADPNSVPRTAGAEGGEARGAPGTSESRLTLTAESLHPAAPPRAAALPRAKEGVAQRSPGPLLPGGTDARTAAPPSRPGHFSRSSGRGRTLTLTRTPLRLFAKVPVPGCLGIGAEQPRPQRQSLRLTSPGGGG